MSVLLALIVWVSVPFVSYWALVSGWGLEVEDMGIVVFSYVYIMIFPAITKAIAENETSN